MRGFRLLLPLNEFHFLSHSTSPSWWHVAEEQFGWVCCATGDIVYFSFRIWLGCLFPRPGAIHLVFNRFFFQYRRSPEEFSQVACWSSCPYMGCGWGCTESSSCWTPAVSSMPWWCWFQCFQQDFTAFIIFILLSVFLSLLGKPCPTLQGQHLLLLALVSLLI